MTIQSDEISADELKVFLEETNEQIQLLDEGILRLEREVDNIDLLQQIFRAAHTIKGSSAMIGQQRMSQVTHAMENLLDKLRNKEVKVDSNVIDALLFGLDAIKVLKEEMVSLDETDFDIDPIILKLTEAVKKGDTSVGVSESADSKAIGNGDAYFKNSIKLSQDAENRLQAASINNLNIYTVKVSINKESAWRAVRCFQVLNELAQIGEVIGSNPSAHEIEQEKADTELTSVICTAKMPEEVQSVLESISEIEDVIILSYGSESSKQTIAQTSEHKVEDKTEVRGVPIADKAETIQSIRIDVEVLDNLMNMVEELVIDRSRIGQIGRMLETRYPVDDLVHELGETSGHVSKIINELHEDIMKARMLPISMLFNKFPRLVRDLARKQHKNLEFIIRGENTELDRSLIEQIRDPLIHLLRNAVDHGVELPEERKVKGKQEKAIVKLSAYQEEGHIVITLEDDGNGIDPAKVKRSAVQKGFISAEAADKLSDAEVIDLIFLPGMSTAEKATEISGRGVGLDIVRANIERLNGSIGLHTEVDKGTVFSIKLPLTLATFQGLVVSVANAIYILPLASVVETIKMKFSDIGAVQGNEIMRLRDSVIPIVRMSEVLGADNTDDIKNKTGGNVIVVEVGEKTAGIIVDKLMEQQEFVIKPLGKFLGETRGIAGATMMGDGKVALILDIPTLVRMATHQQVEKVTYG
jgi:two-component system chemotaxis sensor kinase CheA